MTELLPGAKIPAITLSGQDERDYIDRLVRILQRARLNSQYPDARALTSHVQGLHPDIHQGLYPGVEMDARSGLPTYKEWTRVQTDTLIAPDQLRQLGDRAALAARAAQSGPEGIYAKQLKKLDYYTQMSGRALTTLGEMSVALRRVDPAQRRAWFNVVLDKLDVSGAFVRYNIDLSQTSTAWSKPVVTLDKESARHTEAFQSLIYKFTSLDAEFTYAKLASIDGLQIERVIKGVVGPFCFSPQMAPAPLKPLFQTPQDFVAMFSLDMIAHDLTEDRHNDPLAESFAERLSDEGRQGYLKARAHYGYLSFKDRKFVASPSLTRPLQELCLARGTRNIIYPA